MWRIPVESETGSESQVSATAEAPAATESASQEEVTINFWHHYSAQSAENETLMNVLIPEFEKENPGIKVNAVSHEWADLQPENSDQCTVQYITRCSQTG